MSTKKCRRCQKDVARSDFVDRYGHPNPKAWFCRVCHEERELEEVRGHMDGRDFCLYCGKKIARCRTYEPDGRPKQTFIHFDHMDPLSRGGYEPHGMDFDDTGDIVPAERGRNLVCCCAACNMKKGNMLFTDWLATLAPEYAELARQVYIEKNGQQPEDFKEPEDIVISINLAEIVEDILRDLE